jgi:hypothetical protein
MTKGVAQGLNLSRKTPKLAPPATNDVLANSKKMTGGAAGGPQCFVAGTEILTTEGIKNIEDIQVGDWVIADDPTTPGGIEAKEVLDTFDNEVTELYDLYVDGEVISTTAEHPFWVPDKGWVKASDLAVGDLLQTDEETFVDLDKIERRGGNFKVYNFEVEGFPTYFVSELGILVHNVCDGPLVTNKFPDDPFDPKGNIYGEVQVVEGRVSLGGRQVPRRVDFVVTQDNRLIIGSKHTTLANGEDVLAAGQLKIDGSGRIRSIDNGSGHYRPTVKESLRFPDLLRAKGLNLTGARFISNEFHTNAAGNITGFDKKIDTVLD